MIVDWLMFSNSRHKARYLSTYKIAIPVCVAMITFLCSVVHILPIPTSFDRSGNSYFYSRVRSLIESSETGCAATCGAMGLYSDWSESWYRSSDSDSPARVTGSGFCLGVTSSELDSESPKSRGKSGLGLQWVIQLPIQITLRPQLHKPTT